ncbi:HD domain-containing protein [Geosporobacter ferrireducens]|uniref:Exopolyphosphatase n=1 Tax=Geosporobacter ferrireducens TaxID=1424294 RepID=A0A1D8GJD3_9FIRM|nr:HD domain-containing protein [Geosporobacter ferrireducens]AOT71035.1 hypothetical protein Gferi_16605 [Geosporobacter ferrireducens]MTI58257.1 HD domain-containing protein [Geosporobacter ferrireducens]
MNQKTKREAMAGIDIGSHALRMKIVEVHNEEKVKILEMLRHPISLGRDTFTMGKVRFETVDETCEILKGFKKLMNDYHIETYRAVATSAIREAQNRDYIVDQIKLKTGLKIDVIDNTEERFLTYKSIRENLPYHQKIRSEGAMIVDVGSGSVEISVYKNNHLALTQNIKLGSLRLREVLSSIENRTLNFPRLLEEYISSNIDRLDVSEEKGSYKNFIALGGEIRIISQLCNKTSDYHKLKYIKKEDFIRVYKELMEQPGYYAAKQYGLAQERAEILLPSMMIFKKFFNMTSAKGIHAPLVSLRDGIISDIIDTKFNTQRKADFMEDILCSARYLAVKYKYDEKHGREVEEKALLIFDALKRMHGLGERQRFLLQLAAILHDIGKFVNPLEHYIYSYHIILASNLMGLSREEMEIIANISRYHSKVVPRADHDNFRKLSEENRVVVSKLVAIIRLADALDRSHRQKIKTVQIVWEEKEILFRVDTEEDILLEEWTFETKAEFFKEVFGVTPIMKIKRKMGI